MTDEFHGRSNHGLYSQNSGHPSRNDESVQMDVQVEKVAQMFLENVEEENSIATFRTYEPAVTLFVSYLHSNDIYFTSDINGFVLESFKQWRRNYSMKSENGILKITLSANLAVVKNFIGYAEDLEAVRPNLTDKVPQVEVSKDQKVRTEAPPDEFVEELRHYLDKFHYASRVHVVVELQCEIAARIGALYSLDFADYNDEEKTIEFHHREEKPDKGDDTTLKNRHSSERVVNLPNYHCTLIDDYIENTRHSVLDRFGRKPLLTSPSGRPQKTTLRTDIYKMSRPCVFQNECTVDGINKNNCEATKNRHAHACDGNYPTHPFRRWSIMNQLNEGLLEEHVSSRADVSVPVLEEHYDQRSERRKAEVRRKFLKKTMSGYENNKLTQESSSAGDQTVTEVESEQDYNSSNRTPAVAQVMLTLPFISILLAML